MNAMHVNDSKNKRNKEKIELSLVIDLLTIVLMTTIAMIIIMLILRQYRSIHAFYEV